MTDERQVRTAIRSADGVRADAAFRERLKREFVDGTIAESAAVPARARAGSPFRWAWVLVPAAAAVLLFVLLLPRPAPTWTVQLRGEGDLEITGRTLGAADGDLVARAIGAGGHVRLPEGLALDLRLDERLILELDEGSEVTVPVPNERETPGILVAEVHIGELRIKTGPDFPGTTLHILTPEGRTEIVGTTVSVYRGDGYTCVCVLEGTARVGVDESTLEDVPAGMLKIMFAEEGEAIVTEISSEHEADLLEFSKRVADAFAPRE